jgi:hypothetical protein
MITTVKPYRTRTDTRTGLATGERWTIVVPGYRPGEATIVHLPKGGRRGEGRWLPSVWLCRGEDADGTPVGEVYPLAPFCQTRAEAAAWLESQAATLGVVAARAAVQRDEAAEAIGWLEARGAVVDYLK